MTHYERTQNSPLPSTSEGKYGTDAFTASKGHKIKHLTVGYLCMARFGLLRYCMELLKGLANCENISVILIVTAEEKNYVETILSRLTEQNKKNITIEYVKLTGNLNKLLLPLRIGRLIKKHHVDIIHDPVGIAFTMGFAVWPWISRTAPLLITFHDPKPHSGMGRTLWSRFRRIVIHEIPNKIIVHGEYNAKNAILSGISSDKIIISEHGIHNQLSDFPASDEEPNTVLFFGQLRPNKGMELIEEIAKNVSEKISGLTFIVAGKKPDGREFINSGWTKEVSTILERLGKHDYMELHEGFISDEESAKLFHRASVIILPYKDASQSGVLLLAVALKKMVVLSKVGELAKTAELYGGGITSPYDATIISKAIVKALTTERKKLKKAIVESEQAVAEIYSFDAIASKLLDEYRNISLQENRLNRQQVRSAISQ